MQNNNFFFKFYYQWWKNIDKSIFFLITSLFIMGLFFSLVSTSLIASDKLDTNSYFFFFKHLVYIIIGISIIFFFSLLETEQLFKFSMVDNSELKIVESRTSSLSHDVNDTKINNNSAFFIIGDF